MSLVTWSYGNAAAFFGPQGANTFLTTFAMEPDLPASSPRQNLRPLPPFWARTCVHSSFSVADEQLAPQRFEQGTLVERIEQTLLPGCVQKYVAWRNGQNWTRIASLRYFESTLEEVSA